MPLVTLEGRKEELERKAPPGVIRVLVIPRALPKEELDKYADTAVELLKRAGFNADYEPFGGARLVRVYKNLKGYELGFLDDFEDDLKWYAKDFSIQTEELKKRAIPKIKDLLLLRASDALEKAVDIVLKGNR